MTERTLDVTGIGNAIVDVIAHADDAFLESEGLAKGGMMLMDAAQASALYAKMNSGVESSGGSVANTMAGLASLGGNGAYIGKIAGDQLGEVFTHDIRAAGTLFRTPPSTTGTPTARCLILVTADAQRTMNTYLGACVELGPADIDEDLIARSQVTYLEGYLFDPPAAQEAFRKAAEVSHAAGRKVALTLSDSFCVARHRAAFLDLVEQHIDILFANEHEIESLYEVSSFADALAAVRGKCETAALTRSEKGSVILHGGETFHVKPATLERLVDSTGAGDLYAAGFLYGYTRNLPPSQWGQLGSLCAAEVLSHFGARPEVSLREWVDQHGTQTP